MKRITDHSFFGIPWLVCSIIAATIAVIYLFIWPQDTNASGISLIILKYAHSLVWILLSIAALTMSFKRNQGRRFASYLAKASLGVYVIFMITFLVYKVF